MRWLDPAPDGASVCGGFDGSMVDDWTAIRLETREGYQFTPRYGPDRRPTIWNPAEWGGSVPRHEVHAAWDELNRRYDLFRVYCDPWKWDTEVGQWALLYGGEVFLEWFTNRTTQMHAALDRFTTDLATRALTHDGCPLTAQHVGNARKVASSGDRYILGKPSQTQKIDAAVTSVICHEAAAEARIAGWGKRSKLTRVTGRVSAH
jgi:hypothetical protein